MLKIFAFMLILIFFKIIIEHFSPKYTKVDQSEISLHDFKSIQLLTDRFDWDNWGFNTLGKDQFKNCEEKRCYIFKSDRYFQTPLENSDAILIHGPNLWYMPNKLNYKRNPRQIWAYHSLESPRGTLCSLHYSIDELDDWFNITMTYKLDSTFLTDYKSFYNWSTLLETPDYIDQFKLYYTNEKQLNLNKKLKGNIIWIVSHCETPSRREKYVKEMLNYIDIDIYGNCGSYFSNSQAIPCSHKEPGCGDKLNELLNSYKFYLSFENSLCDDYISEKFWKLYYPDKLFKVNTVPVVRGARDYQYKKVAAPNSYINADNFESPKKLADYLNYLTRNETEYSSYFKWKFDLFSDFEKNIIFKNQMINTNQGHRFFSYSMDKALCDLCSTLHNKTFMSAEYDNKRWKMKEWYGTKTTCWDKDESRKFFYLITQIFGFCF